MISLLIETCTERGIVALFRDYELVQSMELPIGLQNSKYLLSELQRIFKEAALKPKDIQLIVSGIGPGSYTGIRVGAMTAKTLAYALQVPLIGISSLAGFIPDDPTADFAAIIDAKIGGVYLQMQNSKPAVFPVEEAMRLLHNTSLLVTPNAHFLKQKMAGNWHWIERYPDPCQLMNLALKRYKAGERDENLELLYLRKTQAEIERGL